MTRFLLGLVVGSVGTALGLYGLFALLPATREADADAMCPNCVTPWKCNGPHETIGSYTGGSARAYYWTDAATSTAT